MAHTNADKNKLIKDGTSRLIARATNTYGLDVGDLLFRVQAALDKYVLRDNPSASSRDIEKFISSLHADDLCLAVACEKGNEEAWSNLIERFGNVVQSAARRVSESVDMAEELAQSIWTELYGLREDQDGKPIGKLGHYSGQGSLGGWLRAVVNQLAIDRYRRTSRLVQTEDDTEMDRLVNASYTNSHNGLTPSNPERLLSDNQVADDIHMALSNVIKNLTDEDRLLIKLYYFDNLRLREIGALLGVHEATASRRLTRLHTEIRQNVEDTLIKKKGWTKDETARTLSVAASYLETDLNVLLTTEGQAGKKLASIGICLYYLFDQFNLWC
jgi:RNA polymerase sigma-70 factor